jgi:hypothetical protein
MKTMVVTCCGSPGSFVRRVQESPEIAVSVLIELKRLLKSFDDAMSYIASDPCHDPSVMAGYELERRRAAAAIALAEGPT